MMEKLVLRCRAAKSSKDKGPNVGAQEPPFRMRGGTKDTRTRLVGVRGENAG